MILMLVWITSEHLGYPLCPENVGIDAFWGMVLLRDCNFMRQLFLLDLFSTRLRYGIVHVLVQLTILNVVVTLLFILGMLWYLCLRP